MVFSLGVPTRNMHTATEGACTTDVDACLYGIAEMLNLVAKEKVNVNYLKNSHVNLKHAKEIALLPQAPSKKKKEGEEHREG